MTITINQKCICLKRKRDTFKKGVAYMVNYLYQLQDGEFMVNAQDQNGWSVNCYAKRFLLPTNSFKLTPFMF